MPKNISEDRFSGFFILFANLFYKSMAQVKLDRSYKNRKSKKSLEPLPREVNIQANLIILHRCNPDATLKK